MLNKLSYVIVLNAYGYHLHEQERIFLIVVVLLSVAEAQLHKVLAIVGSQGMTLAWNRANKRERLAYENWRGTVANGSWKLE